MEEAKGVKVYYLHDVPCSSRVDLLEGKYILAMIRFEYKGTIRLLNEDCTLREINENNVLSKSIFAGQAVILGRYAMLARRFYELFETGVLVHRDGAYYADFDDEFAITHIADMGEVPMSMRARRILLKEDICLR